MKELVIATNNPDKKKELAHLLKGLPVKVLSLEKFPGCPEVKEGRRSFRENAIGKAMTVSRFTKKPAIADDSGLETQALKGAPGVCSSRFAGSGATYDDNNRKLLKMLKGKKGRARKAMFRCVVAVCDYPRLVGVVEGKITGRISERSKGGFGFGYDPVFVASGYQKTFGELGPKIKHRISHRARALKKAKRLLVKYFQLNPHKAQ